MRPNRKTAKGRRETGDKVLVPAITPDWNSLEAVELADVQFGDTVLV